MKNKINIKKIVVWCLFILAILWLIRFGDFVTNKVVEKDPVSESSLPNPTPSLPAENPEPVAKVVEVSKTPGWVEDGVESGYTMFIPENNTRTQTKEISIENWNTTFALQDCIMQFKKKDGEVVSFRYNSATKDCFLETKPGVFATEKWTEYAKTGMASNAVSFRQDGTKPLMVRVGRRKLAN